ncbi:MAG: hypothetical protein ACI8X5_004246 [Planctomycetota bacterium]|jgi:hypothetical protein
MALPLLFLGACKTPAIDDTVWWTRVEITSTPQGANVYERRLGFLGVTPMTKKLTNLDLIRISDDPEYVETESRLHLTISKPGYDTLERNMRIGFDEREAELGADKMQMRQGHTLAVELTLSK